MGTWNAKASMSIVRSTGVGFSLKGMGYVCAGAADAATNDLKDLWQYDPSTNTWSQKADLPGDGRRELSAFTVGDLAYVGHGRNVGTTEIFYSFYAYDPSANTWSPIADCPVQRYTSTGFSIDSIGYMTCGILPGVARYKDLYAYNPRTDKWTQKASLPSAALNRSYACCVSANHKGYLMGGFEGQQMEDFYVYDPVLDEWAKKANFPGGKRNSVAGFALYGYVYMGMGRDATTATYKDWYYYNTGKDVWTKISDHPTDNMTGHATFVIDNVAYTCTGNNRAGTFMSDVNAFRLNSMSLDNTSSEWIKAFHPDGASYLVVNVFAGDLHIQVYDITGKLVLNKMELISNKGQAKIELGQLTKGIYVADINNGKNQGQLKFIID